MIKSFIEYIFESKVNGVTIYYSKRLRDFLYTIEKISTDVEVARLASALRFSENSNQMSLDITLIDLTDRNDMVSFIQANRILRKFDDKDSKPSPDSFENFEDYLKFIGIIDTSNTLWKEQRGEVGIGKFTRKVFKDNNYPVVDSVLEKFVNFFKATFDFEYNLDQKMELVKGEDIRKWYLESNYSERKGQLGNSCMRYEKCQKYLDIYVKNPEVCSLLVMYSDQNKTKICGRALIWKTTDNIHVMDRIYTVNDYDIEVFRKYAVSKEFIDTSKAFKVKKIQLKKDQVYDYYPYMDNFYIYNYKEFFLTNDSDLWPSTGYYKLQNTDGTNSSDDTVWSDYHDEWIHREDAVYCRNVRDWVLSDEAIWLDYLGIHASPAEETVYSEWGDGSYYLDDVVHSEVMNDYIPSGEIISIFVNAYGDEDYIAKDFAKNALITVDIGVTFSDDNIPGIEVILPNPEFIANQKENLLGIVLTHAHEDHVGAIAHLWPMLECPIYATPFTAAIVKEKFKEKKINIGSYLKIVKLGGNVKLGAFDIDYVTLTHSILEPNC